MIFSPSHLLCTIKSQMGEGQWGDHGLNVGGGGGMTPGNPPPIVTPLHPSLTYNTEQRNISQACASS